MFCLSNGFLGNVSAAGSGRPTECPARTAVLHSHRGYMHWLLVRTEMGCECKLHVGF
jgi:hypothetical protein